MAQSLAQTNQRLGSRDTGGEGMGSSLWACSLLDVWPFLLLKKKRSFFLSFFFFFFFFGVWGGGESIGNANEPIQEKRKEGIKSVLSYISIEHCTLLDGEEPILRCQILSN